MKKDYKVYRRVWQANAIRGDALDVDLKEWKRAFRNTPLYEVSSQYAETDEEIYREAYRTIHETFR